MKSGDIYLDKYRVGIQYLMKLYDKDEIEEKWKNFKISHSVDCRRGVLFSNLKLGKINYWNITKRKDFILPASGRNEVVSL